MNFNKNMMSDIFRTSVNTFKEMESDSKNFRENNKETSSALNTGEIPEGKRFPQYDENNVQHTLYALSEHLIRAFNGLDPHFNMRIPSNLIGLPIWYEANQDCFVVRIYKLNEEKELTSAFFLHELVPELHRRCNLVKKQAQSNIRDACRFYNIQLSNFANIQFMDNFHQACWINKKITLDLQHSQILSNNSIYLNNIHFINFVDNQTFVDLIFRLATSPA